MGGGLDVTDLMSHLGLGPPPPPTPTEGLQRSYGQYTAYTYERWAGSSCHTWTWDPPTHWRSPNGHVGNMCYSIWSNVETRDKGGWTSHRSCLSTASSSTFCDCFCIWGRITCKKAQQRKLSGSNTRAAKIDFLVKVAIHSALWKWLLSYSRNLHVEIALIMSPDANVMPAIGRNICEGYP